VPVELEATLPAPDRPPPAPAASDATATAPLRTEALRNPAATATVDGAPRRAR
jgi:hypothetical protein